jgi:ribonucleotide monophosphatase NagD (HAD superfamily)
VLAIGDKLTEDIKVGDEILWDVSQLKGGYGGNHLVHQDWVQATN